MKQLKVLLADDHELVRRGLRVLIERAPRLKVCGEAATGPQALALALRLRPNVAIVDIGMPGSGGLEVTHQLKRQLPSCEVLIFTGLGESDALIRRVFASGAKSFISKTDAGKFLIEAIESLGAHKPFFTEQASAVMFARFTAPAKHHPHGKAVRSARLSPGENVLVRLLAEGHSNGSVARRHAVSVRAVENQRAVIMAKLQLKSFADLIRYAARNGIIKVATDGRPDGQP
jgi:DNA-binding NarL/FixJ family response regulator